MTAAIANHCILERLTENELTLNLDPTQSVLLNKKHEIRLEEALTTYFKRPIRLTMKIGQANMPTPATQEKEARSLRQFAAEKAIRQDPNVNLILDTFNAEISSIQDNERDSSST